MSEKSTEETTDKPDWADVYAYVDGHLGCGLSKREKRMLRCVFMKAQDIINNRRHKSLTRRLKDPQYSRGGSFH